jgi:hypothetical protein
MISAMASVGEVELEVGGDGEGAFDEQPACAGHETTDNGIRQKADENAHAKMAEQPQQKAVKRGREDQCGDAGLDHGGVAGCEAGRDGTGENGEHGRRAVAGDGDAGGDGAGKGGDEADGNGGAEGHADAERQIRLKWAVEDECGERDGKEDGQEPAEERRGNRGKDVPTGKIMANILPGHGRCGD